ncbi:DUF6294 family protein [Amycolatopsis sp. NPDC051102]|uniref:DUF6294 family protein n=1 Tax=Amycolatopsis sp. NPDC051102 TaxID=3155163 RepID=UPI003446EFC6
MKTELRRLGVLLTLVLAIGGLLAAPASAGTQSTEATCTGWDYCWFTWGRITAGDCTMDQAKWTLYRNGSAKFEAVITSSDSDDAWLMWPVATDGNGFVLGAVTHGGDPKFVRGTVENQWTWWFDAGSFDPQFFDRINGMRLTSHC